MLGCLSALATVTIVSGLVVYRIINRRMQSSSDVPFPLAQLRQMRDQGELTDEEFKKTRTASVARELSEIEQNQANSMITDRDPSDVLLENNSDPK